MWQNCRAEVEADLSRLTVVSQPKHQRIGLFGGTFDPPHVGHLVTAINVRHALNLDVVILMVSHDPWQKSGVRDVSPYYLEALLGYEDGGDFDGDAYGRLGAQVKFNQTWGVVADVKIADGDTQYFVGPRITW